MRLSSAIARPACLVSPQVNKRIRDPGDRPGIIFGGAEVPSGSKALGVFLQMLGQKQVSAQRLQNKLPGTVAEGFRMRQARPPESPDEIRDQLIAGPVSSTYNIACPRRPGDTVPLMASGEKNESRYAW